MTDWFTEEHMTKWEERVDKNKSKEACKMQFEWCYIAHRWYHDSKGTKVEEVSRIDTITQYREAMEEEQANEQEATNKQLQ